VASTVAGISPPITSFLLSQMVVGGSRTVDLTNIVPEVEGLSEGEATYLSLVLYVGLLWIDITVLRVVGLRILLVFMWSHKG